MRPNTPIYTVYRIKTDAPLCRFYVDRGRAILIEGALPEGLAGYLDVHLKRDGTSSVQRYARTSAALRAGLKIVKERVA